MNIEKYIKRAHKLHGDKYDYTKFKATKVTEKGVIICPIHGNFYQSMHVHLKGNGHGCPLCAKEKSKKSRSLTTEEFIKRSQETHGETYDYSKVNYINSNTKVCIICPKHGEFWQYPLSHINGCSCPKCKGVNKKSIEEFIVDANKIHNNQYDYSKVKYVNAKTKVCIICPIHGEFWQTPNSHLNGCGCPYCSNNHQLDSYGWIEKAKSKHLDKYDYSKVNYINSNTKVCIICPEHGEFWQFPSSHLQGHGCPKCGGVFHYTTQQWVDKVNEIHNNRYDYSKVNYVNSKTKVCIICPMHGEFWQTPNDHLLNHGCPMCRQSMLENNMAINLTNNNITFEREKTFDWLIYKDKLYIDFYLPDYNIAIECQGKQHFKPVDAFGGAKAFHECQKRDLVKKELCEKNNVKIFYFSNVNIKYPYDVYNDINKLIEDIYK